MKKKEPRGIRNNNPLNIRKGNNWLGERPNQTDPAFEEFTSMEMGIRAGFKLLRNYITGMNGKREPADTIEKIIRRWAPESENDTKAYIRTVCNITGKHSREKIFFSNREFMCSLFRAMAYQECGVFLSLEQIQTGYDLI